MLLVTTLVFTGCEGEFDDLFGEWSRPTGNVNSGNEKPSGNISVTSIMLDETSLTKNRGDVAVTLTATVKPDNATDKTITWTSENPAVASVSNGLVSIIGVGTAIITAAANDGSGVKATCTVTVSVPGLLAGDFSISSTKKVRFSQGNLQATTTNNGTSWTWAFAEHQWDYIGGRSYGGSEPQTGNNYINGSGTTSANGTVDLFGWSTAATSYGIYDSTDNSNYSGDFKDWGILTITNGGNTPSFGWRTLTATEWAYLFKTRTASTVGGTDDGRYAKATVAGKAGVILFPDSYTHPDGVTAPASVNLTDAAFTANTYDATAWGKMEAAGCVFMPAAGDRNVTDVSSAGTKGNYWSSTPGYTAMTRILQFNASTMYFPDDISTTRFYGYSVRLVYDVK